MKKIIFILLALMLPIVIISCSSDDNDYPEDVPVEESNYYIKYEAQGSAVSGAHKRLTLNVEVYTPDGIKTYTTSPAYKTEFSQVFGPVKKGFNANIKIKGCTYMDCQIYVSENQEPFSLRAEGKSSATYSVR